MSDKERDDSHKHHNITGQQVFRKGIQTITPDAENNTLWKVYVMGDRTGTFNEDLTVRIGE